MNVLIFMREFIYMFFQQTMFQNIFGFKTQF